MKISVIIPTYKPDCTLFECLDSLCKQTLNKDFFEIVLVLNGEKEPYYTNINQYISNKNIKYTLLYEKEGNVSNARNIGIKNGIGDYITFIDSDDFVSNNYLENLLNLTIQENCLAVSNLLCYKDGQLSKDYISYCYDRMESGKKYKHLLTRPYFSTPVGKLLPTNIVKKYNFKKELSNGEDGLFMFELEPYLKKCSCATKDTVYYRRMSQSSLSRHKISQKEKIISVYRRLKFYFRIYFKNIHKYNFLFFCTRVLATIRWLFISN